MANIKLNIISAVSNTQELEIARVANFAFPLHTYSLQCIVRRIYRSTSHDDQIAEHQKSTEISEFPIVHNG
jgi:hypothetical protein